MEDETHHAVGRRHCPDRDGGERGGVGPNQDRHRLTRHLEGGPKGTTTSSARAPTTHSCPLAGDDTLLRGPAQDVVNGSSFAEPLAGNKNLAGGEGNDAVQGGLGSDNVLGGEGDDFMVDGEFEPPAVRDTLSAGDGNDVLNVANKPAGKDVVSCGSGLDRVLADRADMVAPDCEKVFLGPAGADEFFNSIPQSFIEGLNPEVFG